MSVPPPSPKGVKSAPGGGGGSRKAEDEHPRTGSAAVICATCGWALPGSQCFEEFKRLIEVEKAAELGLMARPLASCLCLVALGRRKQ